VAATISGGTPASSSSTALPMRKLCPRTWASMADDQILVTKERNSFLRRFFGSPDDVLYAKSADEAGMEELVSRWFLRAVTGHKGSPS